MPNDKDSWDDLADKAEHIATFLLTAFAVGLCWLVLAFGACRLLGLF